MSQITCPGQVVTTVTGEAQCLDMNGQPAAWTVQPAFSVSALDPAMMSAAYSAGFFLVAMSWAIGKGPKILLSMFGK